MAANHIYLVFLGIFVIGSLALQIACVQWGLRWANVANVPYRKAIGLFLLFFFAALLIGAIAGVVLFSLSIEPSKRAMDYFGFAVQFIASCLVIAVVYKTPVLKAAIASIPFFVAPIVLTSVVVFLIRPFAYEAFVIPTNAMAPTLLGQHWEAPCPRCGSPAFGTPLDPRTPFPAEGVMMICGAERRPVYITDVPLSEAGGDRILVSKLIVPRRWDLIVFRYPEKPSVYYVKRLVGMPNEKLSIHDGAVWINGEKLSPPESIQGIRYSPTIETNGQVYSGPGSEPLTLGPDEYFVLGDFTEQSVDSRIWTTGAPGHPPYAVPESHLVGVAINIYWPPKRWISFR